jgi:hypothetical protein
MLRRGKLNVREKKVASSQRIVVIMAIAPTATDMPQNELYENNLDTARV